MRITNATLFNGHETLTDFFNKLRTSLRDEIRGYDPNYLLNVSETDLNEYFLKIYVIEAPVLQLEEMQMDYKATDIDISQDRTRHVFDRSKPFYVEGTTLTIAIPFSGDGQLFKYQPQSYLLRLPRGRVDGQHLYFEIEVVGHDGESVRREIDSNIHDINALLKRVKAQVDEYNGSLPRNIKQLVTHRKNKLLEDAKLASSLGIPIQRRGDAPNTYAAPNVRRTPKIQPPQAPTTQFQPEPVLISEDYDYILSVIEKMAYTIELSPQAFSQMNEENLRFQFLIPLNSHFERATGETFNYTGKTDILIQEDGKNVFIAECKFWRGEKKLLETIDQLLGYLSWRDTKTAIIIFNRNKNFSKVLKKIVDTIPEHVHYKRTLDQQSETHFRYIFNQPNDPNRELTLAVLVFDMPRDAA